MGITIQDNAPTYNVDGTLYALACYTDPTTQVFKIAVVANTPDGWNSIGEILTTTKEGLVAFVQSLGGIVKFLGWLDAQMKALLASIFSAPGSAATPAATPAPTVDLSMDASPIPPAPLVATDEPATGDAVIAATIAHINGKTLTCLDGKLLAS